MRRLRIATLAPFLLAALSTTGCPEYAPQPGEGPNQTLLRTWGTQLSVAMLTSRAITDLAVIGCATNAPNEIRIPRETCEKIDLVNSGIELAIRKAGDVLDRKRHGEDVNPALEFADLALEMAKLYAVAAEGKIQWSN